MSAPRTTARHHVFTYDGAFVAVWGGPMTATLASAQARRLSTEPGFVTIWAAHYDEACQHGNGAPSPDLLEFLQSQTPFWQRPDAHGGVSYPVATELS